MKKEKKLIMLERIIRFLNSFFLRIMFNCKKSNRFFVPKKNIIVFFAFNKLRGF